MTNNTATLQVIGMGEAIDFNNIKVGDILTGHYMGKYGFIGEVIADNHHSIYHAGTYTNNVAFTVKLHSDCERPQNGLFTTGSEMKIYLSDNNATKIVFHSRNMN